MPDPKRDYGADRSEHIKVRVTAAERDAYDAAAEAAGVSRSEWIRAELADVLDDGPRVSEGEPS